MNCTFHVFGHLMTPHDLVIKCSSLSWVYLHIRRGPLAFMISEGSLSLLKAVCAVWFDLNMAAAFCSNVGRTYTSESWQQKEAAGNVCRNSWYWQTYGQGRRLMKNLACCQVHFCGFPSSLSLSVVCVCMYVHANTQARYLTDFDLYP